MYAELLKDTIEIPKGVTVSVKHGVFTVKGPKGEITRKLYHESVQYEVAGEEISVSSKDASKREKKLLNTMLAHIRNMIQGVIEPHSYKLKVCSGHFPMTVAVKGEVLEVKNLLGEAVPRKLKLNPKVKVTVEGVIITVEAADIEAAGQQAALIEGLCRRPGFDKRIFQDGIYITHKGDKAL
jgi:large subunit ribosomal protein L6